MVEELRRELLAQAYLFDDPSAYTAGVEDALGSMRELVLLDDDVDDLHGDLHGDLARVATPA